MEKRTPVPRGNISGRDPQWKRFDDCAIVRVVGTDYYQPALKTATSASRREDFRFECLATLIPDPGNPHDSKAVKVMIGDHHVGFLARGSARRHHSKLAAMREAGEPTDYFAFVRRDFSDDGSVLAMSLRVPRDGKLLNPLKP